MGQDEHRRLARRQADAFFILWGIGADQRPHQVEKRLEPAVGAAEINRSWKRIDIGLMQIDEGRNDLVYLHAAVCPDMAASAALASPAPHGVEGMVRDRGAADDGMGIVRAWSLFCQGKIRRVRSLAWSGDGEPPISSLLAL